VTVWLHKGTHQLGTTFALTVADSGGQGQPVVYRAVQGAEVRVSGGIEIPTEAFGPVGDPRIRRRLDRGARRHVLQADLKALGVADVGKAVELGKRPELFFNDAPMTLARWPNEGFVQVGKLLGGKPLTSHGLPGDAVGRFTYKGSRPARWAAESDGWLHGYWFWDWATGYDKIASIDARARVIATAPPYHGYGYRTGQRYFALNLLSELDCPGEWYIDRESGVLYFWPPRPLAEGRTCLSVLAEPLIAVKNASHVVLRDLTLECTRGTAVEIKGGERNLVAGCTIRNTGAAAVDVSGGHGHGVTGCEIHDTGTGGISLDGGDRKTLTPAKHYATNNHIHRFGRLQRTYAAAIRLSGVGNRAANNHMHHAPHWVIGFGGNDHVIELNEVHDVCQETGDVGVFYTGRDWTVRGNVLRWNFVHHVHGPGLWGAQVVYLDDAASGTLVYGNVIYEAYRAMLIGGGRDNRIENNVIVDCVVSIHVDNRGMNWMASTVNPGGIMPERLEAVPYKKGVWARRYPELVHVLDDEPAIPKGNVIRRNVIVRSSEMNLAPEVRRYGIIEDNLFTDKDPGFVDAARMDLRLKPRAAVFRRLKGFRPIPFEKIGLRRDAYRRCPPAR
jgi:hypothetical protein